MGSSGRTPGLLGVFLPGWAVCTVQVSIHLSSSSRGGAGLRAGAASSSTESLSLETFSADRAAPAERLACLLLPAMGRARAPAACLPRRAGLPSGDGDLKAGRGNSERASWASISTISTS